MKRIILTILCSVIIGINFLFANEGMWIPLLLEKYTIADMQKKGFKLTVEDIYSINKASLKDAIVIFGRGCTGELVSDQGLLFTNHHCGFDQIQEHSTIEKDYLANGFWAMNKQEELPNPGLTVRLLVRIEDVTSSILNGVDENLSQPERNKRIKENTLAIETKAVEGTHYIASIRPFYYGNEYYLFVYEEFKDIRLVGAPPSAIGKFGGDTDNWMWPRHTGDFSVFRIYADKNNNPADYSTENVPYKPKKSLKISLKGVNENDFTWVLGYPGTTQEYLTSHAIKLILEVRNPNKIMLRDKRLEVMNAYMENNDTIRLKYAGKSYGVSNAWKKWEGENHGLERLDAINKKIQLEEEFQKWAQNNEEYKDLLSQFSSIYTDLEPYSIAFDYWKEAVNGIEIVDFASEFEDIIKLSETKQDSTELIKEINRLINVSATFYKDYESRIDNKIFRALVPLYFKNVNAEFYPSIDSSIRNEFNGGYNQYIDKLLKETVLNKPEKLNGLLSDYSIENMEVIKNDPIYLFYQSFLDAYTNKISGNYFSLMEKSDSLYRIYINGLREMQPERIFYPDANFTMRVAYGKVKGYYPKDGVKYLYYTTLDGVIEKNNPAIYDYDVPGKLKDLYSKKDYGVYEKDGSVPVCFIATNHTTGGNSGSPVLDANGNLIGLNFDRAWEGIASDMMYDPNFSRNVTLDIRYVLFIIDKYAGAKHLLDEMKIIK